MWCKYNHETKMYEVIDYLFGSDVIFYSKNEQECWDYISEHENDISIAVIPNF